MRVDPATCILAVTVAFCAVAQDVSTKPQFLGSWQNAYSNNKCQLLPANALITLANAREMVVNGKDFPVLDSSNSAGSKIRIITKFAAFILLDDRNMIYDQTGREGQNRCRFVKTDAS